MFGKYLFVLINEKPFVTHGFEDETHNTRSYIQWFPLTATSRTDFVIDIERSFAELHDELLDIGNLYQSDIDGFSFNRSPNREINRADLVQTSITYELSLDRKNYKRRVYSFVDFLSDIGGLFNSFKLLSLALVMVFQYQSSYIFIMHDLFTKKRKSKREDPEVPLPLKR